MNNYSYSTNKNLFQAEKRSNRPESEESLFGSTPPWQSSLALVRAVRATPVAPVSNHVSTVTDIGAGAFFNLINLASVHFEGNAPVSNGAFNNDTTTAWYLPGTTGWDVSFDGLPTALWLPQVQTDASLGIRTNQFGFNINWASDQTVVVEASTDLSNPVWTPVSTNTLTAGASYFSDTQWTNFPNRYYRLRSP